MSGSDYVRYTISEKRRRQLEKEQRKLEEKKRREEEEKRRKEAEERRKRQVEEARQLREEIKRLREIGWRRNKTATHVKSQMKGVSSAVSIQPERETIKETVKKIRESLKTIPERLRAYLSESLKGIEKKVGAAEEGDYNAMHGEAVRLAWERLNEILGGLDKYAEEWERLREDFNARIEELAISLNAVLGLEPEKDLREEAESLLERIKRLQEEDDIVSHGNDVSELEKACSEFLVRFHNAMIKKEEREFLMNSVREVLDEMGYQVLELPPDQMAGIPGATGAFFLTPDREAVRVTIGADNGMQFQLFRLVTEGKEEEASTREEMIDKCRNWCEDYSKVLEAIKEKGFQVEEEWNIQPEDMEYQDLTVSQLPASEEEAGVRGEETRKRMRR